MVENYQEYHFLKKKHRHKGDEKLIQVIISGCISNFLFFSCHIGKVLYISFVHLSQNYSIWHDINV